jgi:hypothetical protein
MDYGALELELVNLLNNYFNATFSGSGPAYLSSLYLARVFPESPDEFLQDYSKGLVNVLYVDSEYFEPESSSYIMQHERVTIACWLTTNTARGAGGEYDLISAVKDCLVGYKPTNAENLMWVSDFDSFTINEGQLATVIKFCFDTRVTQVNNYDDSSYGTFAGTALGDENITIST